MRNIWSKLKNIKNSRYLILIPVLVLVAVFVSHTTLAATTDPAPAPETTSVWSNITSGIIGVAESSLLAPVHIILLAVVAMVGALIQVTMYLFVAVAQYDGFANAPAISLGWSMIRDLCNMVIVVYLLYVAFQYALGLGHVELDKSLVNLVLVAIGVNFSKTITLLLVDISQVVMLTFVNSFKNIGVAEIYKIMNIGNFFNFHITPGGASAGVATEFFTIIIMIVVLTVLALFMAILIVRVVMIWLHIVLSPIFIAGYGVSWLKSYQETWKKEMTEYLLIGPCLAFFIWLTFASLQNATTNALIPDKTKFDKLKMDASAGAALGDMGTVDRISGLIIALALLMGGITVCSKYATTIPGGFDKKLQEWSKGAAKFAATKLPATVAKGASKRLTKYGDQLKDKGGVIGGLGKAMSFSGKAVGTGVKVGRGIKEFVEKPGGYAKGIFEEVVGGEAGAFDSALTSGREADLKKAREEQDKKNLNVDALQKQWATASKGGFKDLTQPQIMALFEANDKKGGFKTPDEYLNAMKVVEDAGAKGSFGMPAMTVQWDKEQREKKFGKDSVHSTPGLKMGKDGKVENNIDANIEKAFEMSNDRNEDDFFEKAKNQELNTVGMFGKDGVDQYGNLKEGQAYTAEQFASPILQSKLSFLMGSEDGVLAKNRSKGNKHGLNQNLANLLQASAYEEKDEKTGEMVSKSRLTTDQMSKIERLMAATLIDGDSARKFAKDGGDIKTVIDDAVENKDTKLGVDRAKYIDGVVGRDISEPMKVHVAKGGEDLSEKQKSENQEALNLVNKADTLLREGPKKRNAGVAGRETERIPLTVTNEAGTSQGGSRGQAATVTAAVEEPATTPVPGETVNATIEVPSSAAEPETTAVIDVIEQAAKEQAAYDIKLNIIAGSVPDLSSDISGGMKGDVVKAKLGKMQDELRSETNSKNIKRDKDNNGLQHVMDGLQNAQKEIKPGMSAAEMQAILDKHIK